MVLTLSPSRPIPSVLIIHHYPRDKGLNRSLQSFLGFIVAQGESLSPDPIEHRRPLPTPNSSSAWEYKSHRVERDGTLVPKTTGILATSQVSISLSPAFPFPGPYSPTVLEQHRQEVRTTIGNGPQLRLKESSHFRVEGSSLPCAGESNGRSHKSRYHMSQKPATSENKGSPSIGNSTYNTPQQTPLLPPINHVPLSSANAGHNGSMSSGRNGGEREMQAPQGVNPRPLDSQPSRSLKMHSILNPTAGRDDQGPQRPLSDMPQPVGTITPRSVSDSPSSSTGRMTPSIALPPMSGLPQFSQGPRHSMSPGYLPGRGSGIGTMSLPAATIDAKKSPFVSNAPRSDMYSPGSAIPPPGHKVAQPVSGKPSYSLAQQHSDLGNDRRSSDVPRVPLSQSNSPTTSYSSYGQPSRASPASHYPPPSTPAPTSNYYGPQITLGTDSSFGTGSNGAGQSTYQMMTLDTDQGPIQVPVDVQGASKIADEKRKRNAGASARFRQRRKEKEREASHTISKLETKVREVGEEREYYKMERDYFRSLVYNSSVQIQIAPRMPSPKIRHRSPSSSIGTPEWQQTGERGSDDGRNQRRRLSGYYEGQPPPIAQGPSSIPASSPGFAPPAPYSQYAKNSDSRSQTPVSRPTLPGPPPLRNASFEGPGPQGLNRAWNPHLP